MTSGPIATARLHGALATAVVAIALYWAAAALVSTRAGDPFRCANAGDVCVIPVTVRGYLGGLYWHCNLELSSEVTVPTQYTAIEWRLPSSGGYSFVAGGYAVSILNEAGDFAAASSMTGFRLNRTKSPVPRQAYNYTASVVSDKGEFCMVPTLPRIKNE